jgi:hypothetical protein
MRICLLKTFGLILVDEVMKLLRWLSPLEPEKRHHDLKARRLDNTGSWFLQLPDFELWRDDSDSGESGYNSVLGCYGQPGAGKSILWYEPPPTAGGRRTGSCWQPSGYRKVFCFGDSLAVKSIFGMDLHLAAVPSLSASCYSYFYYLC